MLKLFRRIALPIALLLAVAGCGGGVHQPTKPNRQQAIVLPAAHPCVSSDFYMQCALETSPVVNSLLAPSVAFGVDFAWGAPSVTALRAIGAKFGASYFSTDLSKNWTASTVRSYHAAGLATVGVWETTQFRALAGFSAGRADAIAAAAQARAVGNTDRPITFAIDFDATGPDVAAYFQGIRSVLGNRGNAYGGAGPLDYLCTHHLVGRWNWATYAWLSRTGGAWPAAGCAPLEQYSNAHVVGGIGVDYDRAIAADYGQWPAPVVRTRKPNTLRYGWFDTRVRSRCGPATSEVALVKRYDRLRVGGHRNALLLYRARLELGCLAGRVYRIAHQGRDNGAFVLPPTWNTFHRGWRFQQLIHRAAGKRFV